VPPSYIFYGDVQFLACRGIVNGYGDGTFRPNNQTTRGQFAKIVTIGFNIPAFTPTSGQTFRDVPPNYIFYPYIEAAAHAGAINGYANGNFRPDFQINRIETVVIIQRIRNYPVATPTSPTFSDVQPGDFGYSAVETLYSRGIVSGQLCASGSSLCFRRSDFIIRGELAKIVHRAIEQLP